MNHPGVSRIDQNETHRLIPSRHGADRRGIFDRIADDREHAGDILDFRDTLAKATLSSSGRLPGIGIDELVSGVAFADIVNAAFERAPTRGSRFNGPGRGVWYAGFELRTSQTEVAWHKALEFAEIGWEAGHSATYDDYLADFRGEFHDIRGDTAFSECLDPESYIESQKLAESILDAGSGGIVYPSVRLAGGTCLACFRPALVNNVRKAARYRFTWSGSAWPEIEKEEDHS